MSSGIPLDSNFKNLSCQLGGFRLNGQLSYEGITPVVNSGTAQSLNVITIDDPSAAQVLTKTITTNFLQVTVGKEVFYIPLYQ